MKYYEELKSETNMLNIAIELGFNGQSLGSYSQGDCPKHGSSGGRCFTIYTRTQSFYCFHCGESGDVINLVQLYKGLDHRSAVNYLAKMCGMPPLGSGNLSQEELDKIEAERQEERLVQDILTEATHFYHKKLTCPQ